MKNLYRVFENVFFDRCFVSKCNVKDVCQCKCVAKQTLDNILVRVKPIENFTHTTWWKQEKHTVAQCNQLNFETSNNFHLKERALNQTEVKLQRFRTFNISQGVPNSI